MHCFLNDFTEGTVPKLKTQNYTEANHSKSQSVRSQRNCHPMGPVWEKRAR